MVRAFPFRTGLGRSSPARLLLAGVFLCTASSSLAQAPPRPAQVAVPDSFAIAKLVWSAMAALDQANRTGNYSVLRDLGAPSFQTKNSAATLASIFQGLRAQQIDLGNSLIVSPAFEFPPALVQGDLLRARGTFPLRPVAIGFDMLFQNVEGQWRIFGLAVVPVNPQPASTALRH